MKTVGADQGVCTLSASGAKMKVRCSVGEDKRPPWQGFHPPYFVFRIATYLTLDEKVVRLFNVAAVG
jgi:hypothetical protein